MSRVRDILGYVNTVIFAPEDLDIVKRDPHNFPALSLAGSCLEEAGRTEDALALYAKDRTVACGKVSVPEDHKNPNGRRIDLAFINNPEPDDVIEAVLKPAYDKPLDLVDLAQKMKLGELIAEKAR